MSYHEYPVLRFLGHGKKNFHAFEIKTIEDQPTVIGLEKARHFVVEPQNVAETHDHYTKAARAKTLHWKQLSSKKGQFRIGNMWADENDGDLDLEMLPPPVMPKAKEKPDGREM